MKLPFVSREAFDLVCQARDHERENAQMLRRENADLFEKYHALRVTGANPALQPAPVKPDIVTEAIVAMSRGSLVLRRGFGEFVIEQRAAGATDEDIAAQIYAGIPDDQGVPA